MRKFGMFALLMLIVGAVSAGPEEQVAQLGWLEGNWLMETERGSWEARYTGPTGGMVLSTNKSLAGGKLRSWEFEQFRVHDGSVIMQPYPNGKMSPVFFTLTSLDTEARKAVFENPEHDFPQILTYHRVDDDTLNIKAQARRNGELAGFELILKRVD